MKNCRLRLASFPALVLILLLISSCAARLTHFMQEIGIGRLKDGRYIGKDSVLPLCSVKLSVTVKDGRIEGIKILRHFITYPIAELAYARIPKRIIKEQTIDVDAITGATISTNNIKKAVFNALKKATD